MDYVMVLAGLVLLIFGGEGLVRGSVAVARKLNISELVIGLTLVGCGTSMPELVTSLRAIDTGAVGISIGNVIGSNIANILLVLGAAALLRPIRTNPRALKRVVLVVVGATAMLCWLGILKGLLFAAAGLAGIIFGARFMVDGAVGIARDIGVSEAVIGMSIVAIGTSLPELATSLVAARSGKSDVALGNIIGSNIFNILGILGVTALVHPFSVMQNHAGDIAGEAMQNGAQSIVTSTDIGALVLSLFFLLLFGITGKRIARWEGALLLAGYLLYMGLLFNIIPVPAILPHV